MCLLSPWLVTWPWTLQASLSAAAGPRSIFYVRYQPRPGLVMSDDQAPGADHCRVPADSGVITTHHGTMGWFNWTQTAHWDPETPPAHPQQHNGPLASWERPPLDSLIFNGLMKTLIFTGWTNIWWISILNSLNWKISLGFVESSPGVHFISPNFPADLPSQMLSGRAFSGNLSELNWTWIGSLSSTCLKHKLSLDNEKAENEGQIFNATRVIDIRIRSVTQQK